MIRIISGKYRRAQIKNPDFEIVRPMSDRIREAIFASLQFFLVGKKVLDLFAGTGAIGIEAVSRGASQVLASELNKSVFNNIVEVVEKYKIEDYQVFNRSAVDLLFSVKGQKFDIIFLDPPHKNEQITKECFAHISKLELLSNDGFLIYKTNLGSKLIPLEEGGFKIAKLKKYGPNTVFFLQNNNGVISE